ncbi:endo-1,4-beta-xylanase [Niabella hibiscisoli]|uniref:endo-1,4-beta-xylanase n=1 Tax=Niabella hibiscisoli TaxID=1825928 RepID=UPI001F0D6ACC|nr:endo-1,4-beta-xylanase [Niabella hibiscisoli]MCH5719433.1 endo-1,4-beta-xylanase [Niabella hibiscisoli]
MFKINKTLACSFSAILLLNSCAKFSSNEYTSVDKPETVVLQEEIDAYPGLQAIKSANAVLKLGMALSSAGYIAQDVSYRIAERNFDELVLETEMRHGDVVMADGALDLTGVKKFLNVAKAAGKFVYGNVLTWHTAQNSTYLNGLITGASGITTVNFESDAVGKAYPMTGNSTAVVELDPKGGGSKVLHIGNAATPANQSFSKIDITLPAGIKLGNCSQVALDILAPGSGGLFGSGMRLGINNRALTVYGSPSSFGAADNVWLTGGKVILPISNLNLTAEEKELTTFTLVFGSGTGSEITIWIM